MEPIEFAGLGNLLGVPLAQDKIPRDFADILNDILQKFSHLNRNKRRDILKLIAKSNKTRRGKYDASNSENTPEPVNDI